MNGNPASGKFHTTTDDGIVKQEKKKYKFIDDEMEGVTSKLNATEQ